MPELFTMPAPLIVSAVGLLLGLTVIVNALAPGLKTMLLTSVLAERETPVTLETPNVALSAELLGTVAGVQLEAVFQSPVRGLRFHVALPAEAACVKSKASSRADKRDACDFIAPVKEEKRPEVKLNRPAPQRLSSLRRRFRQLAKDLLRNARS